MNILLLEDESLLVIYNNIFNVIKKHSLKLIKKQNISKLKSKYDICFALINNERDSLILKNKLKDIQIFIFTENINEKFLWNIIETINPIDIININIDISDITKRVISNIEMMEGGVYEKDN